MTDRIKVYLASPFFNPEQAAIVAKIEDTLAKRPEIKLFSPRSTGVLADMGPEERAKGKRAIFDRNVAELYGANFVIAVVDGRDPGTIWEIGFAFCLKHLGLDMAIVTYTEQGFGLNVMIQECVDGHAKGIDKLNEIVGLYLKAGGVVPDGFRNFNPEVT